MVAVGQDKPTAEQLRLELEAEKLRATAIKMLEHAAALIVESAELEKRISRLKYGKPKQEP
jgi:hypothetical protein